MFCPNCNYENDDISQFCSQCGAKLAQASNDEDKWYYVEDGIVYGPYLKSAMYQMYKNLKITKNTYVWHEGLSDWILLRESEILKEEACSAPEWYYAENQQTKGPYTKEQMLNFYSMKLIQDQTLVWKKGMSDWICFYSSGLKQQEMPDPGMLQEKSVVLNVILSIVTCGIFQLYWYYTLSDDVNLLYMQKYNRKPLDPMLNVILCILTCGLYGIYFFWQTSKTLYQCNGKDDTALVTVLSIFVPVVSAAILQTEINETIRYGK